MSHIEYRLPAEWEPQDAVLLVWPHANTDWADSLAEVSELYRQLIALILASADDTRVLLVVPIGEKDSVRAQLQLCGMDDERLLIHSAHSDDTWARDSGPLTVEATSADGGRQLQLQDFIFNGWGNKFSAQLDNAITQSLCDSGIWGAVQHQVIDMVLEGGAIESDGRGTLMTTDACLLNPNRNPDMTREQIEAQLYLTLGAKKVNWLSSGFLAGDDTDSHIDTLARLCPNNVIVYVSCDDPADEHYAELTSMASELQKFRDVDGKSYQLLPLPWPKAIYSEDGHRLPATYANFLIVNGTVLVPTYGDVADELALAQIAQAFPNYVVRGLDCRVLIEQHGSLHCITMQLPKGALA